MSYLSHHHTFYSFFLFQCYAYHRYLHSFPTRRSSDLTAYSSTSSSTAADSTIRAKGVLRIPRSSMMREITGMLVTAIATRSEEHTSELQSHSDLVCRLLLEKKKKKKKNITN